MPSGLIDDGPQGVNTPEFSVSEISVAVKRTLEGAFGFVRVRGEIGRVSRPRSGHIYLDLKDDRSVLSAVCWRGNCGRLDVQPQEGDEVIATGKLTTFPGQSKYQLIIENIAYAGEGALLAKLERLRKALAAEGLFAAERKRTIPYLPRVIGVVTSPSGAVIRDILHRLAERFPVRVLVWPVAVQGAACAPEVANAIRGFCQLPVEGPMPRPDVLIVARGGGSIEDLWGFNEEAVVRAAADCTIPLISAVGHETDTTLIDHAADRRAPTPTAAAEMAVPVRSELAAAVAERDGRRVRALARLLAVKRDAYRACARVLPRPEQIVAERRQRLDVAVARLPRAATLTEGARSRLRLIAAHLPRPSELVERRRERLRLLWATVPAPRGLTAERRHRLDRLAAALPAALRASTGRERQRLSRLEGRLRPGLLSERLRVRRQRLAPLARRLEPEMARALGEARGALAKFARLLGTLGYRETLERGYAVIRDAEGAIATRAAALSEGGAIEIEFADGRRDALLGPDAPPRRRPTRPATPPRRDDGSQGSLF